MTGTPVGAGGSLAALRGATAAERRPLTAQVFTEAEDGQPLESGDVVRTDATGFAEVAYADGSLSRLDAETTLTVVVLDGDATLPEIELDLDVGRVWNPGLHRDRKAGPLRDPHGRRGRRGARYRLRHRLHGGARLHLRRRGGRRGGDDRG